MSKQKQTIRKAKKQKQRQAKIKKQMVSKQASPKHTVEEAVDMALAMIEQDHVKAGASFLEKLKRKHENHPLVQYGLGVLALTLNKYEEAASWFERSVQGSPDYIEAHFNLAVAYQGMMNLPGMVLAYRHVIEHGESGSLPVRKAVETLDRLEQSLHEQDGIGLAEFIEGHHYFHKGLDHMTSKEWDQAVDAFTHSIRVHPRSVPSHGNLGVCYAVQGKKQEALASFAKALDLNPDYEPARVHRAIVEKLGDDEALGEDITIIDYHNPERFI